MSAAAQRKLSVLFVTSEVAPLIKTGGLADVAGSLPAALMHAGLDVRVLVPGYKQVMEGVKSKGRARFVPRAGRDAREPTAGRQAAERRAAVDRRLPALYDRPGGPYQDTTGNDWPDNAVRFGLLSYLAAVLVRRRTRPSAGARAVLHCNDWQTGLAPAYLHFMPGEKARTVMTIHNLAYQGIFPPTTVQPAGTAALVVQSRTVWSTTATCRSSRPDCSTPTTSPP